MNPEQTSKSNTGHSSHTYLQEIERQIYQYFKNCVSLRSSNALERLVDKETAKTIKLNRKIGLRRCRRSSCPNCHFIIQTKGQENLIRVLEGCNLKGFKMYFVTLSIKNQGKNTLFETKSQLLKLWNRIKNKFKRTNEGKNAFLLSGLELIYRYEWLPHLHAIIIMENPHNEENFISKIMQNLHKEAKNLENHAFDIKIEPMTNPQNVATYLYKKWWIEIGGESKNLFDLLSDALNGIVGALELFLEGCYALKGLQNYRIPPRLKLALTEN